MILLDTNVVSEPLRANPDPAVLRWLDAQTIETLCLSAIGLAELLFGIAALPDGQRRSQLQTRLERDVLPLFEGRILAFDIAAASAYASLHAKARADGKAIATVDGYIAAIAAANRLTVATRDTSPFEAAGVPVINPWTI
ncbi:type II toxin-antitoxin system VapC family toxin [Bosea sp. LjRoot9]|uniref:type II toxin-antitoxin system VapC family toxin n=1 Tax=Bosea sp. LjRoot9 TaxID=3342341 RepID=UPI003ECE8CDB